MRVNVNVMRLMIGLILRVRMPILKGTVTCQNSQKGVGNDRLQFTENNKKAVQTLNRASDILCGRGPAKFRYFREIPRNSPKNVKYREIRQKYFQIHVGKTYLILILAIRPVLFTPNVQI